MRLITIILSLLIISSCKNMVKPHGQDWASKFFIKKIGTDSLSYNDLAHVRTDSLTQINKDDTVALMLGKLDASKYYYYSIIDTSNLYSFIYLQFNEDYELAFICVNYDKKMHLIDMGVVSTIAGDGNCFDDIKGAFVNARTFVTEDYHGCYDEHSADPDDHHATIHYYYKVKNTISPSGKIVCDTVEEKREYRMLYN